MSQQQSAPTARAELIHIELSLSTWFQRNKGGDSFYLHLALNAVCTSSFCHNAFIFIFFYTAVCALGIGHILSTTSSLLTLLTKKIYLCARVCHSCYYYFPLSSLLILMWSIRKFFFLFFFQKRDSTSMSIDFYCFRHV